MANNIFFEEQPEQDFDLVPDEDQIDVSLDPDPLFDDGARPRRSRKRTGILIAGGCAVLALLCIGVYFIVSQARASREIAAQAAAEQDEERIKAEMALQQSQEYEAIVNATTFLEGVTVEGIAIGGKTMTEAETRPIRSTCPACPSRRTCPTCWRRRSSWRAPAAWRMCSPRRRTSAQTARRIR